MRTMLTSGFITESGSNNSEDRQIKSSKKEKNNEMIFLKKTLSVHKRIQTCLVVNFNHSVKNLTRKSRIYAYTDLKTWLPTSINRQLANELLYFSLYFTQWSTTRTFNLVKNIYEKLKLSL